MVAIENKDKIVAVVNLANGNILKLKKLTITNFAEQDVLWYTGEDDFFKSTNFSEIIEIKKDSNIFYIDFIRTGVEKVKNIANLKFNATEITGNKIKFFIKDIKSLKFTSAKTDKICEIAHIWLNTDYIFCPYDGTILNVYEK